MSDDAKYLTKQDFVTLTIYGDRTPTTGVSAAEYQPTHENGNLFSYPSAVANIEGYAHRQKVLSVAENFQFGANAKGGQSFTQVKTNETTESKKVSTGYLTDALSLVDQKPPSSTLLSLWGVCQGTRYYDVAITETYEMSNDVAVFWRIGGIADVISNTDSDDSYVKYSAAMPATTDEFSLVWSPSDAGTVKAASANLAVSTIPGVTRAGQYAITVQTSEDGETWTDKEALMLGTAVSSYAVVGASSSSSGCDSGAGMLGLGLLVLAAMRKNSR